MNRKIAERLLITPPGAIVGLVVVVFYALWQATAPVPPTLVVAMPKPEMLYDQIDTIIIASKKVATTAIQSRDAQENFHYYAIEGIHEIARAAIIQENANSSQNSTLIALQKSDEARTKAERALNKANSYWWEVTNKFPPNGEAIDLANRIANNAHRTGTVAKRLYHEDEEKYEAACGLFEEAKENLIAVKQKVEIVLKGIKEVADATAKEASEAISSLDIITNNAWPQYTHAFNDAIIRAEEEVIASGGGTPPPDYPWWFIFIFSLLIIGTLIGYVYRWYFKIKKLSILVY